MFRKGWVKLACLIVAVLSGLGLVPAVWGPISGVVLDNLDMIPVGEIADVTKDAYVVRVVDGDTIEVQMPPGSETLEMLRLVGVDTPETKHPNLPVQFFGPEATEFTKDLCLDQRVTLHFQKDGPLRGRYDRLLVYVELYNGDVLNEEIISSGHGYSYTKYPHAKLAKYEALQTEAKILKKGLWGSVVFEDLPVWLRTAKPDVLK